MSRACAALALLLASCATPRALPGPEQLGQAVTCSRPAPCQREEGVWLPEPMAAHLAGAETCCRSCLRELEQRPAEVPWTALVLGALVGGAAGVAVGAAVWR